MNLRPLEQTDRDTFLNATGGREFGKATSAARDWSGGELESGPGPREEAIPESRGGP